MTTGGIPPLISPQSGAAPSLPGEAKFKMINDGCFNWTLAEPTETNAEAWQLNLLENILLQML